MSRKASEIGYEKKPELEPTAPKGFDISKIIEEAMKYFNMFTKILENPIIKRLASPLLKKLGLEDLLGGSEQPQQVIDISHLPKDEQTLLMRFRREKAKHK